MRRILKRRVRQNDESGNQQKDEGGHEATQKNRNARDCEQDVESLLHRAKAVNSDTKELDFVSNQVSV